MTILINDLFWEVIELEVWQLRDPVFAIYLLID